MDRNQTILAELGPPDVQNSGAEIDVGAVEAKRFPGTQTRACQQSDQGRQHRGTVWISR
jgi:hypothetical protein